MNGDLSLLWWVVTAPARFVYGVAVGITRLLFGDPDPQPAAASGPASTPDGPGNRPQRVQGATEPVAGTPGYPQPRTGALSTPDSRLEETR